MKNYIPAQGNRTQGMSLIELLIVVAIITIFGTMSVSALVRYNEAQTFNTAVQDVVTSVATARSYAQSQVKKNCSSAQPLYGYKIQASAASRDFSVFEVCDTTPTRTETRIIAKTLPTNIDITDTTTTFLTVKGTVTAIRTFQVKGFNRCQDITIATDGSVRLDTITVPCP